jgi:hypothetical protein
MKQRFSGYCGAVAAVCALGVFSLNVSAQSTRTARTADGHPDLNGMWNGTTMNGPHIKSDDPLVTNLPARDGTLVNFERDGTLIRRANPNKPLYKPEFWEKVQKLDQTENESDPSFGCMPAGVPRIGPPAKVVQTPKEIILLYVSGGAQGWGDPYRVIPMDGRAHTPLQDLDGTWKGESVGHWEDDTLVVDTIGFNDSSWLDIGGYFHSENLHVIERIRRDGDSLIWQTTIEDPDVLLKPWVMNQRVQKLNPDPKAMLPESLPCVEHDLSHLVTKEHH